MAKLIGFGIVVGVLVCGTAMARDDNTTETRSVDARVVRVKLDGIIDLKVKQGKVPQLLLIGDSHWVARTSTTQSGDTLSIDTDTHGVKLHHIGLRAELTLPELRELASDSVGWTEVRGFSGDELDLTLGGAGGMKVECNYRHVSATLGGVGNMNIRGANADGIDINLQGAGYVTLTGRSKWLKASLGGLGGLDAQQLEVETLNLDVPGLGSATVNVKQNANLNLSGMGSVTVYGKPTNRNVRVEGLGKVSWKQ